MTRMTLTNSRSRPVMKGAALLAMAFGAVTVVSGGNVLFGPDAAREMAGQFVPFVVWFNTIAGFVYVAAGLAIWSGHRWALGISVGIAAATALVAAGFGIWVAQGGAFEMRTIAALALRFGVWLAIALIVYQARRR